MNKLEAFLQCGALLGLKFQAALDSENPEMEFSITKTHLKDKDGFPAVELTFADGTQEIAAIDCLIDGVKNCGLMIL